MPQQRAETVALFGLPITNVNATEAIAQIERLILSGSTHQIATANLDFARNALNDPHLQQVICDCSLVVPDGAPIVWASKLFKRPLQERVAGVDLVPKLAQLSAERGYGIFLLGSSDASSQSAVDVLRKSYPKINIVGRYSPPARPLDEMDNDDILRRIERAKPDLLLVAFGNPKQELWIHRHRHRLNVPVSIGIGGSLDMIAGSLRRAPRWMQKMDLEWAYRMVQEPGRLFPRYAKDAAALIRHLPVGLMAVALQPKKNSAGEMMISEHRNARVVSIPANLSGDLCNDLRREVETTARMSQSLVFDLTHTTRIEADGLGSLLEARRVIQSGGRGILVAGVNNSVRRVFQSTSVTTLIPMATTPLQAVRFTDRIDRRSQPARVSGPTCELTYEDFVKGWQIESRRRDLVDQICRGYGETSYLSGWFRALRVDLKRYNRILSVNGAKFLKRAMDIIISLVALVTLFPLFLLVALVIHLEDGGPALFWQMRTGLLGREFRFPKFRSMVSDAERRKMELLHENHHGHCITFKMKRDPRVTRVGAILRKLSIDELPQLWCVLRGDMSLVGPRPPLPNEVALYALRHRRRLEVKPGLTCIWQVSGRGELSFEQQVMLDEQYINNHSLLLDIILLFRTIPVIFTGHGAY